MVASGYSRFSKLIGSKRYGSIIYSQLINAIPCVVKR